MKHAKLLPLLSAFLILLVGCQSNEDDLINNHYNAEEYKLLSSKVNIPTFPFSYGFGNSDLGIEADDPGTFGRVLFYDKNLSADGSVSCASCHQQSKAFADNKAFSLGANGNTTARNSIALGSLRNFGVHYEKSADDEFVHGLFWDERAKSVKEQLKQTINNPNEMGMEIQQIVDLVESTDYYRVLHQKAFQSTNVTEDHILEAIETFINSISSTSSNFETEILTKLNFINGDSVVGTSKYALGIRLFRNH